MPAVLILLFALTLLAAPAWAHFQELIPSAPIIEGDGGRTIGLSLTFTHPMEGGPAMEMGPPRRFGVLTADGRRSLLDRLGATSVGGKTAFRASHAVERPGDHLFYLEPAPYWEPSEGKMIVHYTKTVVGTFGLENAWDARVGLPVEIAPLTRPYGLWTGNLFRGVVLHDGRPVPGATIEVEYRSEGRLKAPADPFVTQVIKADAQGVFAYAMPKAGWWGFAALIDGPEPMAGPDGEPVPVELGGLIWINVRDMP